MFVLRPSAFFLASFVLLPSSFNLAFAAFEDIGLGARDLALGGAFTALADDPGAAAYNPAGLAALRDGEFALGWAKRWQQPAGPAGTESAHAAAVEPLDFGDFSGTAGLLGRSVTLRDFARDRELVGSFALRGPRGGGGARLDWGASLRAQDREALGTSGRRGSLGGDAGALYRRGIHALGFSVLNIGAPDLGLAGVDDRAATAFRAGYAQRASGLVFTSDLTHRLSAAGHPAAYTLAAGIERLWGLGAGSAAGRVGLALGNRAKEASAGVGWRMFGLRVDYAALLPLRRAPAGHALTLGFRFGAGDPVSEYELLLSREIQNQRELSAILSRLEAEVSSLRADLDKAHAELEAAKARASGQSSADAASARALESLKARNAELERRLDQVRGELGSVGQKSVLSAYRQDWAGYLKLKASGLPRSALKAELERLLHSYREKGIDVSDLRQELLRFAKD